MVGLSHVAFRELIRHYCPMEQKPFIHTEMLSTRRLPSERLERTNELRTAPNETHFIPQLLGNEERFIAPSLKKLEAVRPTAIDINMGCPVSHVLKHNWGVRLTEDPTYAKQVVEMTKRHSTVPVSVKFRGSARDQTELDNLVRFTDEIEKGGVDWMTVHPRPKENRHSGLPNWELIAKLRARRSVPIIANGDIQAVSDIRHLFEDQKVDGVMIARAATARPWIVWQLCYALGLTELRPPLTLEEESKEYFRACLKLLDLLGEYFTDETYRCDRFRFFAATGLPWFKFGHSFWKLSTKCKTLDQMKAEVADFAQRYEYPMRARTDL